MGIKTDISYSFKSNRLYFGVMHLKLEFDDLNDYIKLFHSIKNSLVESLGYPTGNEENWNNERFRFDNSMIGYAAYIGDLNVNCGWLKPTNNIYLELDNQEGLCMEGQPISLRFSCMSPS
jgi:hypothetical protein